MADCEQRDLSFLTKDNSTADEKALRNPLIRTVAGTITHHEYDEADAIKFIEGAGGFRQLGLTEEQGREFLRVMFGDFKTDPCQTKWLREFFSGIGNSVLFDFLFYTLETAHRRQPMISLLAGIVMCANLIGRKLLSSSSADAVVYIAYTAPSTYGKEQPRAVIRNLYATAGCTEYLSSEDVTSDTALIKEHAAHTPRLMLNDEFNKNMKAASNPNAGWLASVNNFFLKAYSSSQVSVWPVKKWANRDDIVLHKAHQCILASGTPELYEYITREMGADGFTSRFIFYNEDGQKPPEQSREAMPVPEPLAEWVKAWADYRFDPGNISWENGPEARVIQLTPEAEIAYNRFRVRCDLISDSLSECEGASVWGRASKKASDFALILAASKHMPEDEFQIEKEDMEWAVALIAWLTSRSMKALARIGFNEREKDLSSMEEFIKSKGRTGVSKSKFTRKFQRIQRRQRDEHLADLIESGEIVLQAGVPGQKGGPPSNLLFHKQFTPKSCFTDEESLTKAK